MYDNVLIVDCPLLCRQTFRIMRDILAALANRIKELRKERSFSQEAFADHAGLHRVAVGWIEQGKRVPSLKTLFKISQGFGISLSELLRGVDSGAKRKGKKLTRG